VAGREDGHVFTHYWTLVENQMIGHPLYVLGVVGAVWVLGVVLGMRKVIIVYRDFNDLGLVGLTVALPAAAFFTCLSLGVQRFDFLVTPFLYFEAGMGLIILVRTFIDNKNPVATLLAFIVKIPIGILLAINVVDFFTSKTRSQRRLDLFFVLLLSGIAIALVANKRGFLASSTVLRRHGIA